MSNTMENTSTSSEKVDAIIDSVVEFQTEQRLHISLNVSELWKSTNFYRHIFDSDPSRMEPGYTKFEIEEPALNFTLNEFPQNVLTDGHFGIQLKSNDELKVHFERLSDSGFKLITEDGVACCYAEQDKFWCADPDGYRWEFFVTTSQEDIEEGCSADCICHQDIDRTII